MGCPQFAGGGVSANLHDELRNPRASHAERPTQNQLRLENQLIAGSRD
jgi:hypothetical protein